MCNRRIIPLGLGLLLILGTGCSGRQECEQPRLLEDLFDGLSAPGGRAHWNVVFAVKSGVEPEYAAAEIIAYLRKEPGARQTNVNWSAFDPEYMIQPRDFWAKVLADMKGVDVEIGFGRKPHEEKIEAVLQDIARSPDRHPARRDPDQSPVSTAMFTGLMSVRPMVARYIGKGEDELADVRAIFASPMSHQVAKSAGLRRGNAMKSTPKRLRSGPFTWTGVLSFCLKGIPQEAYDAECYYDAQIKRWLVDDVVMIELATDRRIHVPPVQDWNPLEQPD